MTTSISVTKMSLPPTNAAVVMETHESLNSHESLIPGIQGWNSSEGGACETSGTAFPCLADVLEEQVRALEDETSLCLSPPLLLSTSSTPEKEMEDSFEATSLSNEQKYAHIPALRVSTFDNVQQQKMIPVTCLSSLFCASSAHTANRGQRGQSCQQLSPSRVNVQAAYSNSIGDGNVYNPNPNPKSKQGVPLAAALYNADCVRRGKNSVASSWSGCLLSPWCTLPPTRHDPACDSACNSVAVVPGLAAYLPEELAALDLAIDAELPAKGPLPPKAAALVSEFLRENNGLLPTRPDKTSSKKQSFSMHKGDLAASINPFCDWENIDNIDLSDDSSNTGDITVLPFLRGTLTDVESGMSKSSIVDNTIVGNKDQLHEENTQHAISSVERKGGGHHVTKVDVKPELEKPEVPRNVLHPASNGKVWTSNRLAQKRKAAAAAAAGGGGGGATTGGITRGGTKHRKVRKTGAQTRHKAGSQNNPLLLHEDEEGMVEGEVQGGLTVDYEIVTRKKAAAGAQKGSQRPILARRGQQWITEQAKDPRTGELLCAVPPATFCTQCGATSTPVWRAGPFGHKTLCNACGVRWMKVVPPKLKSSRT